MSHAVTNAVTCSVTESEVLALTHAGALVDPARPVPEKNSVLRGIVLLQYHHLLEEGRLL